MLAQREGGLRRLGAVGHRGRCGVSGQGWRRRHALDLQGLLVSAGGNLKKVASKDVNDRVTFIHLINMNLGSVKQFAEDVGTESGHQVRNQHRQIMHAHSTIHYCLSLSQH